MNEISKKGKTGKRVTRMTGMTRMTRNDRDDEAGRLTETTDLGGADKGCCAGVTGVGVAGCRCHVAKGDRGCCSLGF